MEQLQKIAEILHDEKYKNITGLHEAIGHYIEDANKTATDEDVRLKQEEAEVSAEKKYFEGRVCDCIWNEWESWSQCSKTCDEGTKTRERTVVRQATNGGQACEEEINGSEQDSCLVIHCRKILSLTIIQNGKSYFPKWKTFVVYSCSNRLYLV